MRNTKINQEKKVLLKKESEVESAWSERKYLGNVQLRSLADHVLQEPKPTLFQPQRVKNKSTHNSPH